MDLYQSIEQGKHKPLYTYAETDVSAEISFCENGDKAIFVDGTKVVSYDLRKGTD